MSDKEEELPFMDVSAADDDYANNMTPAPTVAVEASPYDPIFVSWVLKQSKVRHFFSFTTLESVRPISP